MRANQTRRNQIPQSKSMNFHYKYELNQEIREKDHAGKQERDLSSKKTVSALDVGGGGSARESEDRVVVLLPSVHRRCRRGWAVSRPPSPGLRELP